MLVIIGSGALLNQNYRNCGAVYSNPAMSRALGKASPRCTEASRIAQVARRLSPITLTASGIGRPFFDGQPKASSRPPFHKWLHEHPLVAPHVSHFRQVPLRISVKLPHSSQLSPS